MSFVLGESWDEDGGDMDSCPDNYDVTFAREFRYDQARARYLVRELDTDDLQENPQVFTPLSDTWTDHDGDQVYGDYTLSGMTPTNVRSFQPGIATVDSYSSSGGANTKYYHGDLIGTTRSLTAGGSPTSASVYTAFGEFISSSAERSTLRLRRRVAIPGAHRVPVPARGASVL